jgi:hypothetical protein
MASDAVPKSHADGDQEEIPDFAAPKNIATMPSQAPKARWKLLARAARQGNATPRTRSHAALAARHNFILSAPRASIMKLRNLRGSMINGGF